MPRLSKPSTPQTINGNYVNARRLGLDVVSVIAVIGFVLWGSWITFNAYADLNSKTADRWHKSDMIQWCGLNKTKYKKLICPTNNGVD